MPVIPYSRIEPWKLSNQHLDKALELQGLRRAAGLTEGELGHLLNMERAAYMDYERGQAIVSPAIMARIQDILTKVASGEIEKPNLNCEV